MAGWGNDQLWTWPRNGRLRDERRDRVTVLKVWAPKAERVRVHTVMHGHRQVIHELTRDAHDWWMAEVGDIEVGTDYGYLIDDDESPVPDPRSRWLPYGVHGLSRIYDPLGYEWRDTYWTGRDLPGAVIYELHIGTFTPEGTFDAAIDRLDHLANLGITHVELLPVNAFNGVHNWGYDGVAWYAVHEPYGGPDGLKSFVDACHLRGLAVILDVVYNHFGPSGNYLPKFGPYLKEGNSSWGDLVNLDGEGSHEVRRYILDNALMWLEEFHIDALRLDAVHALQDESKPHLLAELAADVDALCAHLSRPLILIAESDLNDPIMIESRTSGGYGIDAQWDDDVHHQLHALLTGERQGYYADFGTLPGVAKTLTSGFFHDGTFSEFRGRVHGAPVDRAATPGYRFVVFLQDHDQVGNRAQGDRLAALVSPGLARIGALLLLTGPYTPMLWMGEEWGAKTPWQFFTSHPEKELGELTAHGRKAEFASHGWSEDDVPDPQDPATFERSHLDWSEREGPENEAMLRLYQTLISLRHRLPELTDPRLDRVAVDYDEAARWLI
ncbi:MAG: malto-oligosyltrehalose trehalohydrolase, partial [Pseudonocardiales bacterium]|nr:malto-oligosyltrehalose trehalohydrolase [Pseudonocardiales bacterium]